MSRVLIIGTKDRLPEMIELLYDLENTHVMDFHEGEEGFSIGAPLSSASENSQRLLRLRSIEKDLNIKEKDSNARIPVSTIKKDFDTAFASLAEETSKVAEREAALSERITQLETRRKTVEPFTQIPLNLELYRGYENLTVMAGHVTSDPEGVLTESLSDFEIFKNPKSDFVVVFVRNSDVQEAMRILAQHGFSETPLPTSEQGNPLEVIRIIEPEEEQLKEELGKVSASLEELRKKHAAFILAAEEQFSIEVEKAETPLRFGETAHTFAVEAWMPTNELERTKKAISDKIGDSIYLELLGSESRVEEHHGEVREALEAGVITADSGPKPIKEETPSKLNHSKTGKLFEFYTKLIASPRYHEVDPTLFIMIFFPIFFGLMVGDVGYGAIFIVLGYLGLKKVSSKEWRAIATMLFYGGIFSIIFGLFLFGDMMGIEFNSIAGATEISKITWSGLLGVDIPRSIVLGPITIPLGAFNKLIDVKILLYISLWIGIGCLMLGLVLGFYNVYLRHGLKMAVQEKLSWMMILVGGALLLLFLVDMLVLAKPTELTDLRFIIALALIIPGIILALMAEGGKAIMELPSLLSNVLSYTRLAAIAVSKAGIALAFNTIAITMIAPSGGIYAVIAIVVFTVGQLTVFMLAIISAGLHSIRLQYVEFFTKFFEGGGQEFNPLIVKRKYTTEA